MPGAEECDELQTSSCENTGSVIMAWQIHFDVRGDTFACVIFKVLCNPKSIWNYNCYLTSWKKSCPLPKLI